MQRNGILYGLCLLPALAMAQPDSKRMYRQEISITTENDAYLLGKSDAYYTNGFFISWRKARNKNGKKQVFSYEAAQMIFTPLIRKTAGPGDIDRPYCGYLGLKLGKTSFSAKDALLAFSVTVAELGRSSLGEWVQNGYHTLLHYAKFTGWGYQVQDALGLDLGFRYGNTLWQDSTGIKLAPVAEVSLGMNYTTVTAGSYLCIGRYEKNRNSVLWNAGTGTAGAKELFVFWYPQLIWQGYNATIQGGLFEKGSSAVLGRVSRWMYQQSIGICYALHRFSGRVAYVYQSKEARSQIRSQEYGSLQLSYRLH